MQTDTRKKLDEAIFFLERLRESIKNIDLSCHYYLSAFISAARSVTFIMQKEYARVAGFPDWWKQYDKPGLFQKFNDLRAITVHQKLPSVRHSIRTEFPGGLTLGAGETANIPIDLYGEISQPLQVRIRNSKGGERLKEATQIRDLVVNEYEGDKRREVKFDTFLDEANEYLQSLKEIIEQCESEFKPLLKEF